MATSVNSAIRMASLQLPVEMRADFIARVNAHLAKRPTAYLRQLVSTVLIALQRRSYNS
jgi:hypothetical protein